MLTKNLGVILLLCSGLALAFGVTLGAFTPVFDPFLASGSYPCSGYTDPGCDPPANDHFAQAIDIPQGSLPISIGPLQTKDATVELGEPLPCALKASTIWYRLRPTANATISADTIGSDYDTALAAYRGTSLSELTLLDCNDDSFGTLLSQISFQVTAGGTYYLQVGGFAGDQGRLTLHIASELESEEPPQVFPTSTPIPTGPTQRVGDTNCDGLINAIDATLILQFTAGLLGLLPCHNEGDANGDGRINSLDAALVLQFTAGLLDSLPP